MQVDKAALDALHDSAELHLQSLEPWVQVIYKYQELFLSYIFENSHT